MHRSIQTILTRRKVIAGAVVIPAGVSPAVIAQPADPVLPLLAVWEAARAAVEAIGDHDIPHDLADAEFQAAKRLSETSPTTAKGLALYLSFTREYFGTGLHSGWADDIDLAAHDRAVEAAHAIAAMKG